MMCIQLCHTKQFVFLYPADNFILTFFNNISYKYANVAVPLDITNVIRSKMQVIENMIRETFQRILIIDAIQQKMLSFSNS